MYLKKINLKNKTALVTGAGKGIGKACAIALAEAGADLIIISRTQKDLDQVSKIVKKFRSKCMSYVCDVTNYNQIKNIISKYENQSIFLLDSENIEFNGRYNAIKRCFNNVFDNALIYGKKIEVLIKRTTNNVTIFIDDDGPGIPDNERQNVFKPFYRIDKSRSLNKSGVGLGLSIASDIIQSHGGNISLEKSPANGLRVKISLPT